jgi:hypothetical protein
VKGATSGPATTSEMTLRHAYGSACEIIVKTISPAMRISRDRALQVEGDATIAHVLHRLHQRGVQQDHAEQAEDHPDERPDGPPMTGGPDGMPASRSC